MNADQLKRLDTKQTLAAATGLQVRGIECLMKQRKIPFLRISHRCVRFERDKVLAALRKFEVKSVA